MLPAGTAKKQKAVFVFLNAVPLNSFRWNQIDEELRGWLDLRDIIAAN